MGLNSHSATFSVRLQTAQLPVFVVASLVLALDPIDAWSHRRALQDEIGEPAVGALHGHYSVWLVARSCLCSAASQARNLEIALVRSWELQILADAVGGAFPPLNREKFSKQGHLCTQPYSGCDFCLPGSVTGDKPLSTGFEPR